MLRIARTLEDSGYETWCVGGAVRDNLLGLENKDFDLATAATPDRVRKAFARTVPIGIEHGTVAVLDREGVPHEVTTFRRDVTTDGRHARVQFGVSLDEDLARRDFTINAIAYHPLRREWHDPFHGAADLETGVVRAVGEARERFREDYLRILRALRFAGRFDFAIVEEAWNAAVDCVDGLEFLSAERVRDEWFKGLESARVPSNFVRLWLDVGAFPAWLSELAERATTSRAEIDALPRGDAVLTTAYLSSDPVATLTRLKCSRAQIERGRQIGRFRSRLPDPAPLEEVRRWMSKVGEAVDDVLRIAEAEGKGSELTRSVQHVRQSASALTVTDLAIDGGDVVALGVPEGPVVGAILRQLLDDVLHDPTLNTSDQLLERARRAGSDTAL